MTRLCKLKALKAKCTYFPVLYRKSLLEGKKKFAALDPRQKHDSAEEREGRLEAEMLQILGNQVPQRRLEGGGGGG